MDDKQSQKISEHLVALLGTAKQCVPFSDVYDDFDLAAAYQIVETVRELRVARGETVVGRKIGFTNRSIWEAYNLTAPIWNFLYDQTVIDGQSGLASVTLGDFPEPRIEPEVVLHLSQAPQPGMEPGDLIKCVDWYAAGFEVVYSIFPNWTFTAADAAAAYGVHGCLVLGPKSLVAAEAATQALRDLSSFSVVMERDQGVRRNGHARDVLGSPLNALQHLVEEVSRDPKGQPLRAGEVITTGTLTEAMPVTPGEIWRVQFDGIDLKTLEVSFN